MMDKTLAVTATKNEGRFLLEWVAFHKTVGFDEILIFSNDNSDQSAAILAQLSEKYSWMNYFLHTVADGVAPQMQAYRMLKAHLTEIGFEGWIALIDADEFVYPHDGQTIREVLSRFQSSDVVFMNWRMFGSSGHVARPADIVISAYQQCAPVDFNEHRKFKALFRFDAEGTRMIGVHWPHYREPDEKSFVFSDGKAINRDILTEKPYFDYSRVCFDGIELRHYAIKSWQDFEEKKQRGRGALSKTKTVDSVRHTDRYFRRMDRNDVHYPIDPSREQAVRQTMLDIYEGADLSKIAPKDYFGL